MLGFKRLIPAAAVCMLAVSPAWAATITFSNATPISIPDSGAGSPYPSTIAVAGFTGLTTQVTATLYGLSHTFVGDLDILLVSPTGLMSQLMSDVGGLTGVTSLTLTFNDAGPVLPGGAFGSGTYQPTDLAPPPDVYPAPAPAGPYAAAMSTFIGGNPNGIWQLFINDDAAGDVGVLSGGWSLDITADIAAPPAVPEPASLFMLGIGAAAIIRRRRSAIA